MEERGEDRRGEGEKAMGTDREKERIDGDGMMGRRREEKKKKTRKGERRRGRKHRGGKGRILRCDGVCVCVCMCV